MDDALPTALRIRVSIALVAISICKQGGYSDEVFPTRLLFRKKTRTKTNDRKLYPVVVTAANKVTKRVKIHHIGIFVILAVSLCVVELFLKFLSLGDFILQRFL